MTKKEKKVEKAERIRKEKHGSKETKEEQEINKISNKALVYIAIILVVIFFLSYISYRFYVSSKRFEYLDLKFEKIKIGNLTFYLTYVPLYSKDPLTGRNVNTLNFSLYFRNDPRELENISINGILRLKTKVIMASDELKCEDNGIAGGELGQALSLWAKVFVGTTNKTKAEKESIDYASCNAAEIIYLDSSVLIFKPGNATIIEQKGKDCYEISVANCEVVKAVERLIIGLYAHTKEMEV